MQVATGQFEATLPCGPNTKASLEIVSLAARLTQADGGVCALWSIVPEVQPQKPYVAFAKMEPINITKHADDSWGAESGCWEF